MRARSWRVAEGEHTDGPARLGFCRRMRPRVCPSVRMCASQQRRARRPPPSNHHNTTPAPRPPPRSLPPAPLRSLDLHKVTVRLMGSREEARRTQRSRCAIACASPDCGAIGGLVHPGQRAAKKAQLGGAGGDEHADVGRARLRTTPRMLGRPVDYYDILLIWEARPGFPPPGCRENWD